MNYVQIITLVISFFAVLSSFYAIYQNRKINSDNERIKLLVEKRDILIDIKSKLNNIEYDKENLDMSELLGYFGKKYRNSVDCFKEYKYYVPNETKDLLKEDIKIVEEWFSKGSIAKFNGDKNSLEMLGEELFQRDIYSKMKYIMKEIEETFENELLKVHNELEQHIS